MNDFACEEFGVLDWYRSHQRRRIRTTREVEGAELFAVDRYVDVFIGALVAQKGNCFYAQSWICWRSSYWSENDTRNRPLGPTTVTLGRRPAKLEICCSGVCNIDRFTRIE